MDKRKIHQALIDKLQSDLELAQEALKQTKNLVQSDDFKSESKYDTRAIEAGQLAGAQQLRVDELKQDLEAIKEISLHLLKPTDEVVVGAFLELEHNQLSRPYYLVSLAGGTMLNIDGKTVMVISVFSPLGSSVLGLKVGENFEVEVGKETRLYSLKSIS